MIPYADFTYFVLLLYVAVPTVILGVFGRAGWRWALVVTTVMLLVQYRGRASFASAFPEYAKSGSYWRSPSGNG